VNKFLLSYNDCSAIRDWYKDFNMITPSWQYTFSQGDTRIGVNRLKNNGGSYVKKSHELLNYNIVNTNLMIHYDKSICIVGTRNASSYALERVSNIVEELVKKGYCIISGLARGTDGEAHRSTIRSGGKTIAVLPLGIEYIYPPEHKTLYHEIIRNGGGLISEYFNKEFIMSRESFRDRNRIISGLSKFVFIVEGSKISGSLSQYHHAKEQHKIIFTLRPSIHSGEVGALPKKIISEGGNSVEDSEDVLRIVNQKQSKLK
jgi:DNA processing protein